MFTRNSANDNKEYKTDAERKAMGIDDTYDASYLENLKFFDIVLKDMRLTNKERAKKIKELKEISPASFERRFGEKSIGDIIIENNLQNQDPIDLDKKWNMLGLGEDNVLKERTAEEIKNLMKAIDSKADIKEEVKEVYRERLKKTNVDIYEDLYGPILKKSEMIAPRRGNVSTKAEKVLLDAVKSLKKR